MKRILHPIDALCYHCGTRNPKSTFE